MAAVAALAYGAGWLLEAEGGVRVVVAGTEYNFGALESVIGLLLLVVAVYLGLKVLGLLRAVWKFLNGDETAITRYFARNRAARGYDALSEALMALASGEGRTALAKAEKWSQEYKIPEKNIYDYQSFDDIANNPDIEVIYIVLPNSLHAEYTIRALEAGKHVICEKPMATSVAEAEAMMGFQSQPAADCNLLFILPILRGIWRVNCPFATTSHFETVLKSVIL